ncbi:MAG: M1 family metallopeptidase [Acidobacteriaceae bacterium]|nr:M1 family metallopeptidase [Acidobacteriaceae bacterium]
MLPELCTASYGNRRDLYRSVKRLPVLVEVAVALFVFRSYGDPTAPTLRLPDTVRPLRYSASLQLTPGQDRFSGTIRIDLDVRQPTSTVWLNAKALQFESGSISHGGSRIGVQFESVPKDFLAVKTPEPLAAGKVQLEIKYTGEVSRTLTDGAFQQQQGKDWYIFTKFEPVTARRVFPCFDEPSFKVPWTLTLTFPKDLKAFSNTEEASEQSRAGDMKAVTFGETKPLPSYLIAFGIGQFDVVPTAPIGKNHRSGRIIVPRGRASEAAYAASITPKLVELLENYFGTVYPYEKLDQIVVPLTTAWGAMENAGLIAYGDFLLSPPQQDTELRKRNRAATMEHEMSHQWFGDLVTTAWWDDIWLNEAFASWLESKLLNEWKPEWNIKADSARFDGIMRADSLTTARKIRQPIEAPGDIANAFDGITYGKGEAVIGMFENYIGAQAFQSAVRLYLRQHAWGNATAADLLSAIDQVSPEHHAGAAFASFLNQVGFPLISVEQGCALDNPGPPVLHLSQKRFLPVGSPGRTDQLWQVPVCAVWSDGSGLGLHRECHLLSKASDAFHLQAPKGCPVWLSADANATGYYAWTFVLGEADLADTLVAKGVPEMKAEESAALLRNIELMFSSGLGNLGQDLAFADRFAHGSDPGLMRQSAMMVSNVSRFVPQNLRERYAAWIRALYQSRALELGWYPKPGESQEIRLLRMQIVPLVATRGEHGGLQTQAEKLARRWLADRTALDPDMVEPVLGAAAWNGNRAYFDELVAAVKQTKIRRERLWMLQSLPDFRAPALARASLDLFFESGIDPREMQYNLLDANEQTRQIVWDFVRQSFDRLNQILPGARGIPFGALLPLSASGFCDASHQEQLSTFFQPRLATLPGGARNLANALEDVRLCAARAEVIQPAVSSFLQRVEVPK